MSRMLNLPVIFGVAGALLVAVGLLVGEPEVEIEGAYFNRSVGQAGSEAVFSSIGRGLLSPADGNLWLGAGIALLVAAAVAAATSRRLGSS